MKQHPYRVFLSYSREDSALMEVIHDHLSQELGCIPVVDQKNLVVGRPFDDRIRECIEQAHVFLPLLTQNSKSRPWVHQEIGYAMGKNVPILPLALDSLPDGMLGHLQALQVKFDLTDLADCLTRETVHNLVDPDCGFPPRPVYEYSRSFEERTEVLVSWAQRALNSQPGRVRIQAAFSSFSIPKELPTDSVWQQREGTRTVGEYARGLLHKERMTLMKHAAKAGCDLILNPESVPRTNHSPWWDSRLNAMIHSLTEIRSSAGPPSRVVVTSHDQKRNLCILSDAFLAEAVVPFGGGHFRNTMFTRHAPTVLERIMEFEGLMEHLLEEQGVAAEDSLDHSLEALEALRPKTIS